MVLIWGTIAALLVMGFTAAFAAGIVHHLLSGRHVALVGRRVMPRAGHVIVVGMGQVGLRLAQELRDLGVAVVGIERFPEARGLPLARDLGIPVIIGDAASRRVLARAGLSRAAALVAAGSEERDNIAVAISAAAGAPTLPVVIRAGADDAIDETRSLFHIGPVADVNGLTAAFVTRSMIGDEPYAVIPDGDRLVCVDADRHHRGSHAGQPRPMRLRLNWHLPTRNSSRARPDGSSTPCGIRTAEGRGRSDGRAGEAQVHEPSVARLHDLPADEGLELMVADAERAQVGGTRGATVVPRECMVDLAPVSPTAAAGKPAAAGPSWRRTPASGAAPRRCADRHRAGALSRGRRPVDASWRWCPDRRGVHTACPSRRSRRPGVPQPPSGSSPTSWSSPTTTSRRTALTEPWPLAVPQDQRHQGVRATLAL